MITCAYESFGTHFRQWRERRKEGDERRKLIGLAIPAGRERCVRWGEHECSKNVVKYISRKLLNRCLIEQHKGVSCEAGVYL